MGSRTNLTESSSVERPLSTVACIHCKRTFWTSRISKHQAACRTASSKRPVFDMQAKRLPFLENRPPRIPASAKRPPPTDAFRNTRWHQQHADVLANLRRGRKLDSSVLSTSPVAVRSPSCQRPAGGPGMQQCRSSRGRPSPSFVSFTASDLQKSASGFGSQLKLVREMTQEAARYRPKLLQSMPRAVRNSRHCNDCKADVPVKAKYCMMCGVKQNS